MRNSRLRHLVLSSFRFPRGRVKHGAKIESEVRTEHLAAGIHLPSEERLVFVKFQPHVHMLGALAGKQESDARVLLLGHARADRFCARVLQGVCGFTRFAANQHSSMTEFLTAHLQGVSRVRKVERGVLPQVCGQFHGGFVEGCFSFGRDQKQLCRPCLG